MDRLEAAKFAPWITCMARSVPSNANLVTSCLVRPKELVKKIWRAPLASGLEMIQRVNVSYVSHDIIYVLIFAGCWLFPWESEIAKYKDQFRGWILLVCHFFISSWPSSCCGCSLSSSTVWTIHQRQFHPPSSSIVIFFDWMPLLLFLFVPWNCTYVNCDKLLNSHLFTLDSQKNYKTYHYLLLFLVVRCPRLPLPPHGVLSGCGFGSIDNVFGDKCLYNCDIGYLKINGSSERVCQANGTWSGQPPDCQGVSINKALNGLFNCFSCYRYQNEITIDEMASSRY